MVQIRRVDQDFKCVSTLGIECDSEYRGELTYCGSMRIRVPPYTHPLL